MSDARPGPFLVLTGPTAVGKTALSLEVAQRLGAEIISADSRQIYRRLSIGTAKPSLDEQRRIPHHFVDELPLGAPWSAGRFADAANARIRGILKRGRFPLVVGGSTLYLEALVHGLADVPVGDPEVRTRLMQEAVAPGGGERLFEELMQVDPAGAATLDPSKTQRLVRALEVVRSTGRPWSAFFSDRVPPPYRYRVIVLTRPRADLYRRIEARVDRMLEEGLLEENRQLLSDGYRLDTNPLRTIGYHEPFEHLVGVLSYADMVERLKRNSRRYAKRQLTWFRRRVEYEWLDVSDRMGVEKLLQ